MVIANLKLHEQPATRCVPSVSQGQTNNHVEQTASGCTDARNLGSMVQHHILSEGGQKVGLYLLVFGNRLVQVGDNIRKWLSAACLPEEICLSHLHPMPWSMAQPCAQITLMQCPAEHPGACNEDLMWLSSCASKATILIILCKDSHIERHDCRVSNIASARHRHSHICLLPVDVDASSLKTCRIFQPWMLQ